MKNPIKWLLALGLPPILIDTLYMFFYINNATAELAADFAVTLPKMGENIIAALVFLGCGLLCGDMQMLENKIK